MVWGPGGLDSDWILRATRRSESKKNTGAPNHPFTITLPETNITRENRPSQRKRSYSNHPFQGRTVSFMEGSWNNPETKWNMFVFVNCRLACWLCGFKNHKLHQNWVDDPFHPSYPHWRGWMRCLYYKRSKRCCVSKWDTHQPNSSQIPWKWVATFSRKGPVEIFLEPSSYQVIWFFPFHQYNTPAHLSAKPWPSHQ